MEQYKIILASNSPRRKELLSGLGIDFEVRVLEGVAESFPNGEDPFCVPEFIAREKAAAYSVAAGELLITADTVVIVGNEILGKPNGHADACRMLRLLSGKTHHVATGVCLTTATRQKSFTVKTVVTFKDLSEEEIEYYVSKYKPFDKAGAYGIQEWIGFIGVTGLQGSFYNVMGFPVQRVYEELVNGFGVKIAK